MSNPSLKNQIAKNYFYSLSAMLISRAGGFIFTVLLARFLMPEFFGLYNLVLSTALIFVTLADFGINQTLIRYVSEEFEKNPNLAKSYFKYLLKLRFYSALIFSFLLFLLAYPISYFVYHKPETFILIFLSGIYVFFVLISGFFETLFYAKKEIRLFAAKEFINQISRITIAFLVFIFASSAYYVFGLIMGLIISTIIVLAFVIFVSFRLAPFFFNKSSEKVVIDKKKIHKFLLYLSIGSMSASFFSYMDIVMLGSFVSSEYIGYYKAVSSLIFSISGLLFFYNILMPFLVQIDKEKQKDFLDKIWGYIMIITIPAVFGFMFLGKYFIKAIYGSEYLIGSPLVYIFAPIIFIESITLFFYMIVYLNEKPEIGTKYIIPAAILNIILNFLLMVILINYSELYACMGVALATLLSRLFFMLCMGFFCYKKLKFKINLQIFKPILASLVMIASLYLFSILFADMTFVLGLMQIFLGIVIYFVFLLVLGGFPRKDLDFALNFIKIKNLNYLIFPSSSQE